jgi:hypothetical protein
MFDLNRHWVGFGTVNDSRDLTRMTEAAARTFAFIFAGGCINGMF